MYIASEGENSKIFKKRKTALYVYGSKRSVLPLLIIWEPTQEKMSHSRNNINTVSLTVDGL